jgi:formylglycine-generating enzyme
MKAKIRIKIIATNPQTPVDERLLRLIQVSSCVLIAAVSICSTCFAQEAVFFRVGTISNQVIINLSGQGVLSWSAAPGYFSVERSTNLSQASWAPWARGTGVASTVSLKVCDFSSPADMVFIPAGYFNMGDTFGDVPGIGTPVHPVYVSAFYIDKFEVTNEKVAEAYNWAYSAGKLNLGSASVTNAEGTSHMLMILNQYDSVINFSNGKFVVTSGRSNHPAIYVTWYGCVAYCNYRSQMEGLNACYDLVNWTCDFSKNGYRLPTEAEWEKSARGGAEGHRFPWTDTDTIQHSQANYRSSANNSYDISPTRDYNPAGGPGQPLTTAVGHFAANGYGLFDMAGNNWEFCWDFSANYPYTTQFDPTGPATGIWRIFRGGSWRTTAERVTCGQRYISFPPENAFDDIGLRVARSYIP